ncbi:MAG: glycosyltransferase family 4 protein [Afipia sp.]|nr:glycosyltransferase family 4 protein [Afipia sp.]
MIDGLSHDNESAPRDHRQQSRDIFPNIIRAENITNPIFIRPRGNPHLLCVGGEDHHLRIPFLLALRERGFRVTAAGSGDGAGFIRHGIEFHPFHFDRFVNPRADRSAIDALTALLVKTRPDIVQSFDTKPNLLTPFAARQLPGIHVVRTINGLGQVYSSRSATAMALRLIFPALHRAAARFTALTIFQNRDDQTFFDSHRMTGKGRSRLIPGSGVDIEGFERAVLSAPSSEQIRHELNLGGSKIVLTVTRMTRQKGIPTLLAAAALVNSVRPDVRFLLVGPREGEGSSAVPEADISRHAPYVIPLGMRSDIPALLGLSDVFAFPTEYREGVPRVLLEAALANLPIVTTNMPGCTDVVTDRSSGFVVPPRDPALLAARILDMLRDGEAARTMARLAGALVRREFGLQLTADRYAEAYNELINPSALRDFDQNAIHPASPQEART